MGYLDIGTIPSTFTTKEEIVGVMLKNMEVGLKISNTIPCSMLDKVLMELVEADLGLIPAPPPPHHSGGIGRLSGFYTYG